MRYITYQLYRKIDLFPLPNGCLRKLSTCTPCILIFMFSWLLHPRHSTISLQIDTPDINSLQYKKCGGPRHLPAPTIRVYCTVLYCIIPVCSYFFLFHVKYSCTVLYCAVLYCSVPLDVVLIQVLRRLLSVLNLPVLYRCPLSVTNVIL